MRNLLATTLCLGLIATAAPALAQGFYGNQYGRQSDPNMGHFYMGRQQIQILDAAPMVNDLRTNPAAAGAAAAVPQRPAPLPRAGFMPYSQSAMTPSMQNSLPKVVNGVPPKPVPVAPPKVNPQLAKAKSGQFKAAKLASPVSSVPKSYAPYKGYGGPSGVPSGPSNYGGPSLGTSTAVSGSLLHWSRTGRNR